MSIQHANTISNLNTLCNKRLAALRALPPTTPITIAGKQFTPVQAIAVYEAVLDLLTVLATVRSQGAKALADSRAANTAARTLDKGIRAWAATFFPVGDPARDAFDADPKPKTTPKTADQAFAAEKALATRKARGTKGPKAKLKIKGTVVAPTAQAAPAPTPTVTTVTVTAPGGSPVVTSPSANGVITHA